MSAMKLDPGDALKTYRYLRIGMVCAVLLLMLTIAIEAAFFAPGCMQTSVSAYYYTPVRAIFVGALMAIGFALIVIKGPPVEDISLNVAGMFAPMVAIIPTAGVGECWSIEPQPSPLVGPVGNQELAPWVVANIQNNFYALICAGFVAIAVAGYLAFRDRRRGRRTATSERNMRISVAITGAILLVSLVMMVTWDGFKEAGHYAAAILMFLALNIAVLAKALERKDSSRAFFGLYSALAGLMSFGGAAIWLMAVALGSEHHVLIIEIWEISMFAAFWVVQTRDNWDEEIPCLPSG